MRPRTPQPLRGLKVVEFAHVIAGPYAGMQMALLGAEVTKVEPPAGGDYLMTLPHGQRAYAALNGLKRIERIDLASAAGLEQARALVDDADILVDSFAPGALARKGLGYETLADHHRRLIYCSISGFGTEHAGWGARRAYDHVVQAMTGMALQAGHEGDPPIKVGFPVVDTATGALAVTAVLTALLERHATGAGQYLEVSMARAALQLLFTGACETALTGRDVPRVGNIGYSGSPAAQFFACREGHLALGANTEAQIERAVGALGAAPPPLQETVPRQAAERVQRHAAAIEQALRTMDAAEAEQRLTDANVPAARIRTLLEFLREAGNAGWLDLQDLTAPAMAAVVGTGWRSFEPGAAVREGAA
jgi:crotonobetainyl-CoA:carnitine CoA-transferase CaiB-like acyl-CoA transferase